MVKQRDVPPAATEPPATIAAIAAIAAWGRTT